MPPAAARAVSSAVPILPSLDLDRSLAFYAYLGFELLSRTADYLRVALDGAELHLYLDPDLEPVANGAGCYLRFADPGALRAAWSADRVDCLDLPDLPGAEAYGPTDFAVIDPGGNTLRVGPLPTFVPQSADVRLGAAPQITESP